MMSSAEHETRRDSINKGIGDNLQPTIANQDNTIQVGEILLSSNSLSLDDLISRMLGLLDHDTIKQYLSMHRKKKAILSSGSYVS